MDSQPCTAAIAQENSTVLADLNIRPDNEYNCEFLRVLGMGYNPEGRANTSLVLFPPPFPFERIDAKTVLHQQYFFYRYWWLAIPISILYIVAINMGQNFMKTRQPLHLRRTLIAWNVGLCLFSMLPALRAFPFHYSFVRDEGLMESLCYWSYDNDEERGFIMFWMNAFGYSKVAELFDTAFIVLRKRPLIFLHWYHHVTVLWFVWFTLGAMSPVGGYFFSCNCFIHFLMYGYYAVRAMGFRVPKIFQASLTGLQILQMIFGIIMTSLAFKYKRQYGDACFAPYSVTIASVLMYISYWFLFSAFFYKTYVTKEKQSNVFTPAQLIDSFTGIFRRTPEEKDKLKLM